MNLKDALARVDDLLPALEKLLAPDAMLALRTVYDAAHGCAAADALRGARQTAEEALRTLALGSTTNITTPHLFVGRPGGTCYLCPHPRDHDIHPNRVTP